MQSNCISKAAQGLVFSAAFFLGGVVGSVAFLFSAGSGFELLRSREAAPAAGPTQTETIDGALREARRYLDNGEANDALALAKKIIGAHEGEAKAYIILGDAHLQLGDLKAGAAAYKRAWTLDPQDAETGVKLGDAMLRIGRVRKALAAYEAVLGEAVGPARLYNSVGVAHHAAEDRDVAKNYYYRAISADPRFAAAYNNLGIAFVEEGDVENARGAFLQALELDPGLTEAWRNFALTELSTTSRFECRQEYLPNEPAAGEGKAVAISGNRRYEVDAAGTLMIMPDTNSPKAAQTASVLAAPAFTG